VGLAAVVVLAIGLAHLGLYLLLTASARREVERIEERYAVSDLASGRRPQSTEVPDAVRENRRAEFDEQRRAWEDHRSHVSTVGWALLASFLVQSGLIAFLRLRAGSARRGA
jgi:hypothetical protein